MGHSVEIYLCARANQLQGGGYKDGCHARKGSSSKRRAGTQPLQGLHKVVVERHVDAHLWPGIVRGVSGVRGCNCGNCGLLEPDVEEADWQLRCVLLHGAFPPYPLCHVAQVGTKCS